MMAVSVKDGEPLVDLLLSKGADVNITSWCIGLFLLWDGLADGSP